MKGFFSDAHCEDLGETQEWNSHKWEPPLPLRSGPAGFLTLSCPRFWAQKFITTVQVSLPGVGSCGGFWSRKPWFFCICPPVSPVLEAAIWSMTSLLRQIWNEQSIFQFVHLFFSSSGKDGPLTSKLLPCRTGNWQFSLFYSLLILWVLKIKPVTYNYISLHMYYQEGMCTPVPSALLLKASSVSNFLWLLPGISPTDARTYISQ